MELIYIFETVTDNLRCNWYIKQRKLTKTIDFRLAQNQWLAGGEGGLKKGGGVGIGKGW